jgi:RNA polymerase sigma factor
VSPFRRARQETGGDADALLAAARCGDAGARDGLIRSYLPFILKVASRTCGRYLQVGRDDEVSVGLMAFNEAIDRYQAGSGSAFAPFAEMVIRRRLIDHFRREAARREMPLSEFEQEDEEGEVWSPVEVRGAVAAHQARTEAEDRREEVRRYREVLGAYGIRMEELVRLTPRHRDARERAIAVAREVAARAAWSEHLRRTRSLPLREMERVPQLGVSRKTLERQRKYIVAVALLFMEDLGGLRALVPEAGGPAGAGGRSTDAEDGREPGVGEQG